MSHTVRPPGVRRRFAALAFVFLLLGGAAPLDQPTGTIEGHVRDQSGAPVANAQVVVVGTPLNALTDTAGAYRMKNVPVGEHTVRAAFIGFRATAVMKVLVLKGKATRVDITIEQSTVETEEITVVTQAQPLVPRDETARAAAPPSVDGVPPLVLQPGILSPASPTAGLGALGAFGAGNAPATPNVPQTWNTENYAAITESRFLPAASNPRSTFSIDVDAASYTNVRRFLTAGQRPPKDAVRIEEFLNYFRYDYPEPRKGQQFSVTTDVGVAPWAPEHRLVRIGIRGRALDTRTAPPSNLVFLIDVSGSMTPENKLPLVKTGLPDVDPAAPSPGPRRHRRLRGRGGSGPAVHAGFGQGDDSRGDRPARGRWKHGGRRGSPACLRDRRAVLRPRSEQPRHPGHRR